jgi:hypothetical protein
MLDVGSGQKRPYQNIDLEFRQVWKFKNTVTCCCMFFLSKSYFILKESKPDDITGFYGNLPGGEGREKKY